MRDGVTMPRDGDRRVPRDVPRDGVSRRACAQTPSRRARRCARLAQPSSHAGDTSRRSMRGLDTVTRRFTDQFSTLHSLLINIFSRFLLLFPLKFTAVTSAATRAAARAGAGAHTPHKASRLAWVRRSSESGSARCSARCSGSHGRNMRHVASVAKSSSSQPS